jgi:hypothetical protein
MCWFQDVARADSISVSCVRTKKVAYAVRSACVHVFISLELQFKLLLFHGIDGLHAGPVTEGELVLD